MSKFAKIFLKTLTEKKENKKPTGFSKTKKGNKSKLNKKGDYIDTLYQKRDKVESSMYQQAFKESVALDMEAAPAVKEPATKTPPQEETDEEVWKRSLDKGTNPEDFNIEDNPQLNIDTSGVEAAREWISKLEDMAEFVNGTGPESLNSKINDLEVKNSIPFRGVVRREEKRITKVAENLRGLAEVFKSVVITSQKKIKDANER